MMSVTKLSKQEDPPADFEDPALDVRQKFYECIKGPANVIKTIVFLVCFVVVVVQVTNCVVKIIKPPITTYTHFDYNDTIQYPSVTLCKNPEYKHDALEKYNLYSHPRYTSTWQLFPFESVSVEDAWKEFVFTEDDVIIQAGFNGSKSNLKITPNLHFVKGMCYTLTPRIIATTATKETGFSLLLSHTQEDVANSISTSPPGYYMYIHPTYAPFTELTIRESSLMEHLYVNVGEEVEVKLSLSEYSKISNEPHRCLHDAEYSTALCGMVTQAKDLAEEIGCSGPWMETEYKHCNNYTSMRQLIVGYLRDQEAVSLSYAQCPRRCRSLLYNANLVNRQQMTIWDQNTNSWSFKTGSATLQTQIYIYFNSMVVTVFEEQYNYDWSLFLSDLGGTIGFLLGLSVIGFIKLLSKTLRYLNPVFKSKIKKEVKFSDTLKEKHKPGLDSPETYLKKYYNLYNDYHI